MPKYESSQLESWLELLCQMLPGISQAVIVTGSTSHPESAIRWPRNCDILDDVTTAAGLAASQKKSVTSTLSSSSRNDSAIDMIIALPLKNPDTSNATLAILVNIKPSQQSVVMQILHWGEDWLGLLLKGSQAATTTPETSDSGRFSGLLRTGRSRLIILALILLAGFMAVVSGTYRVTASASLEGRIQRVIVAPFDGYISSAFARAGETVAAGDVIAQLETQELLLQQQRYAAEKNEYTRQYRQALAVRDKTQAHIFKSQVGQTDAQLRLLEKKIERSALVSTLDGVIISGDLSRSLGAPVETGQVLFEVAPLDEYRLIIFVDEKQVADVQPGLHGILILKALPAAELNFTVFKVSPVFEDNVNGISYRVEARLDEQNPALRPGMQGVAKIDIDQRSYLWIYLHELFDAARLWAWRWIP